MDAPCVRRGNCRGKDFVLIFTVGVVVGMSDRLALTSVLTSGSVYRFFVLGDE